MKPILRLLILTILVVIGCAPVHREVPKSTTRPGANLTATVDPILHQLDHTGAIVSARVIDLATGQELYATRADEPFTPASNMKLQTAAAALDLLGAEHVFQTYVAMDGDDLWLIGTGDPACGDSKIAAK